MAETTADVRRDIELTRERMSDTLSQLERKLNVMQVVRDNPWPSVAVAAVAGFVLAGSRADVKAAAATVKATGGASRRVGEVLDDLAASVIGGVTAALQARADDFVHDLKRAIGAPTGQGGNGGATRQHERDDVSLRASAAPGGASETGMSNAIERGESDRQLLGVSDSARRTGAGQALGINLPAQDSAAIGGRRAD